jgi:hypothetical protein
MLYPTYNQFCLKTGNGEVRRLGCFNLAKYFSWLPDIKRRCDDMKAFQTVLAELNNNCYMKIAYIDFVEGCLDLFSKKFFLQQELFKVLEYATDDVLAVRIKLTKVIITSGYPLFQLMVPLQRKIDPENEELN